MPNKTLLKTNIIISLIIIIGFSITSYISYRLNFNLMEKDIEHVSTLASDGIYYQINSIVMQPISVSLTMANDTLLKDFLAEEKNKLNNKDYIEQLRQYLNAYREKYKYDSVFLVSADSNRYYHFNGLDRVLSPEESEDIWYYQFLNGKEEYSLNIDNDQAADNSITVFVNCKIKDRLGNVIGVVGVGVKVNYLQQLLKEYDQKYKVKAMFINDDGIVQISSSATVYETKDASLFASPIYSNKKADILNINEAKNAFWFDGGDSNGYIVSRYIPQLKWYLIVGNDTSAIYENLHSQFTRGIIIILSIIASVIFTVTKVIRRYNEQISHLSISQEVEYQRLLRESSESLYENIFEFNITNNCASSDNPERYFNKFGITIDTPYNDAIKILTQNQVKEEHIQGYLDAFNRENILAAYHNGISNLTYDCLIANDDKKEYQWIRIMARIFFWVSDQSVRMISYRINIDDEKKRELSLIEKSQRDSLTNLLNKRTTEEVITDVITSSDPDKDCHAFIVLDIDNFKSVNDKAGHAFGDFVIKEFADEIQAQFHTTDVIGRMGGDEFIILMKNTNNLITLREKLERFCGKIARKNFGTQYSQSITTSIGVALYPDHADNYKDLYEKADKALYYTKSHGKGYFHIFAEETSSANTFVSQRDMLELLNTATDGISKLAFIDKNNFKLLYFNQKRIELTGTSAEVLGAADYNLLEQIHADDLPKFISFFAKVTPDMTVFSTTLRLKHNQGHYIPIRFRGYFTNELYKETYPIMYAVYTDMSYVDK